MKNSIDAHIEFSFKGEVHTHSATIELDDLHLPIDSLEPIYQTVAQKNGIDTYSYLYEVMLDADIHFDNPQGFAQEFLHDGNFDFAAFAANAKEHGILMRLQEIAARELGVERLEQNPPLKNALYQAYRLGKNESNT